MDFIPGIKQILAHAFFEEKGKLIWVPHKLHLAKCNLQVSGKKQPFETDFCTTVDSAPLK